jgi:hypothetical protein
MEQLSLTDEPAAEPVRPAQRRDEPQGRDEPPSEAPEPEVAQADDDVEEHVAVPDTVAPRGKKRPERRRVPSWDEIMFGGRPE